MSGQANREDGTTEQISSNTYMRWENPLELARVARYEWGKRRAWKTRRAGLRGLWWWLVRRYSFELCEDCGRPHVGVIGDTFWHTSDDLWARVVGRPGWEDEMGELAYLGPGGTLCPACFTARAESRGIRIHWEAVLR